MSQPSLVSAALDPSSPQRRMAAYNPNAPACTALNDSCPHPAIAGADVCRMHGGSAPQVRRAARRRLAIAEATKELADLDYAPVTDPAGELADVAGQAKALMGWAAARVVELHNEIDYRDAHDVDQVKAVVGVYERAIDRTGRLMDICARLGIEQRRVALEEATADLIFTAIGLAVQRVQLAEPERDAVIDAFVVAVKELESANSEPVK